ncbi:MAG: helix-turn-helix transcriptional regulator [Verrucomicrobiales bacterium]|nr:helix-turn-helix transcriptional regulator [Verrucomicrobiales bacterium]
MHRPTHVRRSGCPIGLALDLVGDRWTLLIVRDLMFRGFHEFGEFLRAGEGISTNILTDRLRRLTSIGLVVQSDHPSDGKKFVYRLTEKGVDLAPILVELTLWGAKHFPDHIAPPDILRLMRTAPERLIGELRARLLAEQAPSTQVGEIPKKANAPDQLSKGAQAVRRPSVKRLRKGSKTALSR